MQTDKLIQHLVDAVEPVRPLPRPWLRTACWLALALPYMALVVLMMSSRDDLAAKIGDWRFVIEQLAALATGVAAAMAAFASTVPGFNRKYLLVPVLPLAIWLGSIGQGCLQAWMQFGVDSIMSLQSDWMCFPAILLVGAVPAVVMAFMLRRGAPLTPYLTAALGGLAVAGIGNFGLRLFHPQDASIMVLVWQIGTVFVLTILAGWAGRFLLDWRSMTGNVRRRIVPR